MTGSDNDTAIAELRDAVRRFVAERDWGQFHNAKDLSISLCLEAAELLEEFQWLRPEEVEAASRDAQARARVAGELADVLIYAFSLANALDLDVAPAVREKLAASAHKYPADRFRGRFRLEE
ncbi:MAG: nucleotide pyrophosphohydrolase [Anaerolineae bacterium]|jgi:NTP pyrophosphatase (non-canonical NTP hydrolase)|nr:nucleotide pyrophosphohydrolase [Anaerolineae bacterium]